MQSRAIAAFLLAAFALTLSANTAQAQLPPDIDPQDVFERCVKRTRKAVTRCTNANAEQTKECVRKIKLLLRAGNEERARRVAKECIEAIERRTSACADHIREDCRECIEKLLRLDAPRLARRLREVCDNALDALRHNARRSVRAIKSAF